MSKLITLSLLTRFWQKAKTYIDNALTGKAATDHMHDYGELMGLPTIPTTVAQLTDAAQYAKTSEEICIEKYGQYAKKADMTNVYKYKGSKTAKAELPATGNTTGDVWNVEADGMNYAWNGTEWDNLGTILEVAAETEIDAIFA